MPDTSLFTEFGIIGGAFIVSLLTILGTFWYILTKALPNAYNKHVAVIDKMQTNYEKSLDRITDKHRVISEGFLLKLANITKEHEEQNRNLENMRMEHNKLLNEISNNVKGLKK